MTTTATPGPVRQLVLPGQADAPDGPVDLTLMWLMHHGFRRDLAAFGRAAEHTPLGDRDTWRELRRRWELFARTLHEHHTSEDAGLWPLLLDRVDSAGDRAGRATLEALAAEHAGIDPLLGACSHGFARLAGTADAAARDRLVTDLGGLGQLLHRHLAHEEGDGMRVVQERLTQADWDEVGSAYFDAAYTPTALLRVVAWALHDLPPEGLDGLRRQDRGPVLVTVWRLLLRRPFARRERRAFRYA